MTVKDIARALAAAGIENAAFEARLLVSHFEGISMAEALTAEISKESFTSEALASALSRRLQREPLAYITGKVGFYGEELSVTPDTLIPRADTEILVEEAIKRLPKGAFFADIGTGSGAIVLSVLKHRPDLSAVAVDISPAALAVAKRNAKALGALGRVHFLEADALEALPEEVTGAEAILSNPPYIESAVIETLAPELAFEPALALDGGADGLSFYRAILEKCTAPLFLFEIGYNQAAALTEMGKGHNFSVCIKQDFGGNDRVAILSKAD